ncbi:MAG TPA: hypothetical protein HPP94_08645 [Desulfuromonadales bacterium]|nr:hypothetical protein [Desulfuromonadales bacterium]
MTIRYSNIAADIKTRLEAVPGSGIIHIYERQAVDLAKFIGLFKDGSGRILGWEITRKSVMEHQQGIVFRHHAMMLHGYMGLQDAAASGVLFQDLCDTICDAFRTAEPLSGSSWMYRNGDDPDKTPAQIELIDDRMFGSVLCHHALISLSVTERIAI